MNLSPTMKHMIRIAYKLGVEDCAKEVAQDGMIMRLIGDRIPAKNPIDDFLEQFPHRGERIIEEEVKRRVR